jgi:hypothetical protein
MALLSGPPLSYASLYSSSLFASRDLYRGQWAPEPDFCEEFASVIHCNQNPRFPDPVPVPTLFPTFVSVVPEVTHPPKRPKKRKSDQRPKLNLIPRLRSSSPSLDQTVSGLIRSHSQEIGEKPVIRYQKPEWPRRPVGSSPQTDDYCINI